MSLGRKAIYVIGKKFKALFLFWIYFKKTNNIALNFAGGAFSWFTKTVQIKEKNGYAYVFTFFKLRIL